MKTKRYRNISDISHSLSLAARGIRSPGLNFTSIYLTSKPYLDSCYPIPERRKRTR